MTNKNKNKNNNEINYNNNNNNENDNKNDNITRPIVKAYPYCPLCNVPWFKDDSKPNIHLLNYCEVLWNDRLPSKYFTLNTFNYYNQLNKNLWEHFK